MTGSRTLLLLALAASVTLAPSRNAAGADPKAGDQVPDFAFTDFDGHQHRLSDFARSYVLLDFWATWCAPCLKEVPDLKEASERFRSRGLVIIGMNSDKQLEKAQQFMRESGVPWLQSSPLSTKQVIKRTLKVQWYPALILLAPGGKILEVSLGEKPPLYGPLLIKTLDQTLPPAHP